jgi:hypothetical protein
MTEEMVPIKAGPVILAKTIVSLISRVILEVGTI